MVDKHKVFVSFHDADHRCKDKFVAMMGDNIVNKSVGDGDIDDTHLKTSTIRQTIRDNFIADATVTVVLIGTCTWQRKHVDWEIGSSLRDTKRNPKCGLLGIFLPTHPDVNEKQYNKHLIPPRLADNCTNGNDYASVYDWSSNPNDIKDWIHKAFIRRDGNPPNNGRDQFKNNRTGDCSQGWQS